MARTSRRLAFNRAASGRCPITICRLSTATDNATTDGSYAHLDDDDELRANFRGSSVSLTPVQSGMVFDYEVQIPFESPLVEGETLELVLDRGTEVDAPSSSVTVPADITITAFPASASRASDLTFSWSPVASDEIRWDILGNCLQSIGAIDHDVGSATVTPSEIQVFDSTVTCDANLIVTRDRAGTFDPAFASGYMTFEREDHVVYSSTP